MMRRGRVSLAEPACAAVWSEADPARSRRQRRGFREDDCERLAYGQGDGRG